MLINEFIKGAGRNISDEANLKKPPTEPAPGAVWHLVQELSVGAHTEINMTCIGLK